MDPIRLERSDTGLSMQLPWQGAIRSGAPPVGRPHNNRATELALQTDKSTVPASNVLDSLRHRHIILPRRSPAPAGASTMLCPSRYRTRIAVVSTTSWSAATTARRPGCTSRRPSQIRSTCRNTSNASRRGSRSPLPSNAEIMLKG